MADKLSLWNPQILSQSVVDSFRKLDPRLMMKNPVMFVVEIGSVVTTALLLLDAVRHQQRVARVRDQRRQLLRDAQPPLGSGQEHHAAVGGDASAVECSGDFLASDGWKAEGLDCIVRHGGCGSE